MRFCLALIVLIAANLAFGDSTKPTFDSYLSQQPQAESDKNAPENKLNAELKALHCDGKWTSDHDDKFGPSGASGAGAMDSEPSFHYLSDRCKIVETDIQPVESCPSGTSATRVSLANTPGYKVCVKKSESARKGSTKAAGQTAQ